jgi:hypothetical protein
MRSGAGFFLGTSPFNSVKNFVALINAGSCFMVTQNPWRRRDRELCGRPEARAQG